MFLAAIGLEPYQSMNLLITEQKIGIDELFSPVKSSYTTSPSTTSTSTNDVSDTADKERSR